MLGIIIIHLVSKLFNVNLLMRIILNLVSYALYNDKRHLIRPLLEIMEGKNAGLNQANYKLIRLAINLPLILVLELGKPILT